MAFPWKTHVQWKRTCASRYGEDKDAPLADFDCIYWWMDRRCLTSNFSSTQRMEPLFNQPTLTWRVRTRIQASTLLGFSSANGALQPLESVRVEWNLPLYSPCGAGREDCARKNIGDGCLPVNASDDGLGNRTIAMGWQWRRQWPIIHHLNGRNMLHTLPQIEYV